MLVLTLKKGAGILIGDSIRISLVEMRSGQAKIGIEAPRDTRAVRETIADPEVVASVRTRAKRGHSRKEFRP